MFELADKSGTGVEIHASRPVFRRGKRQSPETIRRMRDILINQLASLGMDPEDIAKVFRDAPVCARQVRNRLSETPTTVQSQIAKACHEIMNLEREKAAQEHRPLRPPGVAVRPRRYRIHIQRTLFEEVGL
jgi:hypothetical protein